MAVIQLKRNSTAGVVPAPSSLTTGELAVNTADAALFLKKKVDGVDYTMKATSFRPAFKAIAKGHNVVFIIAEGMLYACGGAGGFGTSCRGYGNHPYSIGAGFSQMNRVYIPSTSPVIDAGGTYGGCFALTAAGELFTWGYNTYGACGLGNTTQTPFPVLSNTGVTKVFTDYTQSGYDVNYNRIFILKNDGYLYGSGWNGYGALGNGTTTNATSWVKITQFSANTISNVFNLGNGYGCTFVQTTDGKIWATGYNGYGQLGNGNTTNQSTFIDVTANWVPTGTSSTILRIGGGFGYLDTSNTGHSESSVIMMFSDRIMTCGNNTWGQLGCGSGTASISTPYRIPSIIPSKIAMQGGGPLSISVLTTSNEVWQWGYNDQGQLGIGTTGQVWTPTKNTYLSGTVSAPKCTGFLHDGFDSHQSSYVNNGLFLVLNANGNTEVWAAGAGVNGNLGNGTTTSIVNTPVKCFLPPVELGGIPTSIVSGGMFATTAGGIICYAVSATNRLYVWGYNGNAGGVYSQTLGGITIPYEVFPNISI